MNVSARIKRKGMYVRVGIVLYIHGACVFEDNAAALLRLGDGGDERSPKPIFSTAEATTTEGRRRGPTSSGDAPGGRDASSPLAAATNWSDQSARRHPKSDAIDSIAACRRAVTRGDGRWRDKKK